MQVEIPREAPPTFPREMSHPTTLLLLRNHCTLFSVVLSEDLPLPLSVSHSLGLLLPLLPHFLSAAVPSRPFVSRPFAPSPSSLPSRSYLTTVLLPFLHRAILKLAFSLLSSEAADFPHFTFQSHEGCDFLPHFHSDNIARERRRADGVRRESKRDSFRTLSTVSPWNGRIARERMDEWNENAALIRRSAVNISALLENTICSNDSETDQIVVLTSPIEKTRCTQSLFHFLKVYSRFVFNRNCIAKRKVLVTILK